MAAKRRRILARLLAGAWVLAPHVAAAQWAVVGKAALPAVPYWRSVNARQAIDMIPLVWTNEVDGSASGCCVVGAAVRHARGDATLWVGLGFGTSPDGGTPAAVEAAVEIGGGLIAFRALHGRSGLSVFYPLYSDADGSVPRRIALGLSSVWLYDERYVPTLPLFDCPQEAPSAPCGEVVTPYAWSDGQDNALVAEVVWGSGTWEAPRLEGSFAIGTRLAGGDHGYGRAELEASVRGAMGRADWRARLAGGWASAGAPLQRRFFLYGADPVTRWLNPYLDVRGGLFNDVPYVVPGGAHLRAYEETAPLVKRYIAALAELSRAVESRRGFWGQGSAFFEAAWTPELPRRLGPEALREDGALLFDWRELPVGEGAELGQFRARSLEVSGFWADAGLAITGGYRKVAATISLPIWASEPAFAGAPIGGGAKQAFALRWTLTFSFFPMGRPGG